MVRCAEEYPWSSYRTIIAMHDDHITQVDRTWRYFKKNPVIYYREFMEDVGRKYKINKNKIQSEIGEDDIWLPW